MLGLEHFGRGCTPRAYVHRSRRDCGLICSTSLGKQMATNDSSGHALRRPWRRRMHRESYPYVHQPQVHVVRVVRMLVDGAVVVVEGDSGAGRMKTVLVCSSTVACTQERAHAIDIMSHTGMMISRYTAVGVERRVGCTLPELTAVICIVATSWICLRAYCACQ